MSRTPDKTRTSGTSPSREGSPATRDTGARPAGPGPARSGTSTPTGKATRRSLPPLPGMTAYRDGTRGGTSTARSRSASPAGSARRGGLTRRGRVLLTLGGALLAGGITAGVLSATGSDSGGSAESVSPYVGGDLHTVTTVGDRLFVAGHEAAAVSDTGGRAWQPVATLQGADAMGWASTPSGLLVGGHPGLYRSTDRGATFTKLTGAEAVPDVHALGAAGTTAYLASPRVGLLASTDGGTTWTSRNPQAGRSFMGTMLVDPTNPQRVIAPDMQAGLVESRDGGGSWAPMGGPQAAMGTAWNPVDRNQLVAVGMMGSATSRDGGRTWSELPVPAGTSAAAFSSDGRVLYAAALDGENAVTYASSDGGQRWTHT